MLLSWVAASGTGDNCARDRSPEPELQRSLLQIQTLPVASKNRDQVVDKNQLRQQVLAATEMLVAATEILVTGQENASAAQELLKNASAQQLPAQEQLPVENPFEQFFDKHTQGQGIWKWRHYFPVYQKHLSKFIGRPRVNVAEIGIYSGGSLEMWRSVIGTGVELYGFDIAPVTKKYEELDASQRTHVFIGDQADPQFWAHAFTQIPELDVLIDDGGHAPYQQMGALRGVLEHLRPGGVFITEDVHGSDNPYVKEATEYLKDMNAMQWANTSGVLPSHVQDTIEGIYQYPYMLVVEKAGQPRGMLHADKRGTLWEPIHKGVTGEGVTEGPPPVVEGPPSAVEVEVPAVEVHPPAVEGPPAQA